MEGGEGVKLGLRLWFVEGVSWGRVNPRVELCSALRQGERREKRVAEVGGRLEAVGLGR